MNLPNLISSIRLFAIPLLLTLAWQGHGRIYLVTLALVMLTDALDGYLARRWNQVTELGSKLDSWGDLAIYTSIPIAAWWLWPEIIQRESPYVITAIACYLIPLAVGLIKFRGVTSYHTWAVKLSAVVISPALIILFLGGPAWPFHLAIPICIYASVEEVAISLILSRRYNDIPTFWHAMQIAKRAE